MLRSQGRRHPLLDPQDNGNMKVIATFPPPDVGGGGAGGRRGGGGDEDDKFLKYSDER